MSSFSRKFYLAACVIMAVITAVALIVTLYVGTTGNAPAESLAWNALVLLSLISMGSLTVLCLCVSEVGGKVVYKIGFYILHAGLVVLIVGFVLTNLASSKHRLVLSELEAGGDESRGISAIADENGRVTVSFSHKVALKSIDVERYENGRIKHYEAVLALIDKQTGKEVRELPLTVNNPVYIDGYKVYLMVAGHEDYFGVVGYSVENMPDDQIISVQLLVKDNPGEFVVLAGIVVLTVGTFVMCFSGGFSFRGLLGLKRNEEADEQGNGKKVKKRG